MEPRGQGRLDPAHELRVDQGLRLVLGIVRHERARGLVENPERQQGRETGDPEPTGDAGAVEPGEGEHRREEGEEGDEDAHPAVTANPRAGEEPEERSEAAEGREQNGRQVQVDEPVPDPRRPDPRALLQRARRQRQEPDGPHDAQRRRSVLVDKGAERRVVPGLQPRERGDPVVAHGQD